MIGTLWNSTPGNIPRRMWGCLSIRAALDARSTNSSLLSCRVLRHKSLAPSVGCSIALALALTFAPVLVGVARGQGSDTIEPLEGRDIRCIIKGTTPQAVQYETNGQSQQIGVVEIKSVKFAGEPAEFARARNRLQGGQFDDCLAELQKITPLALNDLLKAEYEYLSALAEGRKSLRDGTLPLRDAAKSVNQFLQSFPNSFHFLEMTEIFGWLAFHSGEFAAAEKSFQTLVDSQIPSIALDGQFGLARTAMEQSQWDVAQKALSAITSNDANDDPSQELKLIARCWSARLLAEQNQAPQAIGQLQEIIKAESDDRTRVFANLYNALGLAYLRAGDPKNALLAFLHTDQLYANEADPHAEALYYMSALWSQLNETDRSNRAKQALSQQYRNSLWATKK